jgi:thimet oligopeptidase
MASSVAAASGARLTLGPLGFGLVPEALRRKGLAELDAAKAQLEQLLGRSGEPTVDGFLVPLNDVVLRVRNVSSHGTLIFAGHPDETGRTAGREVFEAAEAFLHALRLNERLYAALRALGLSGADPATRFAIDKLLRAMRRSGVEKDAATRSRLLELNREIDLVANEFEENIAKLERGFDLESPKDLAGLPDDYRASHAPGKDGRVRITTRYSDCFPVLKYADRSDVRRQMLYEFLRRAYPENLPVLRRLLALRHELAVALGYPNYAAFVLEDKMLDKPEAVRELLDRLEALLGPGARRDLDRFLARKQRSEPGASHLDPWDAAFWGGGYYDEKIRSEEFGVDLRTLRKYLPYTRVREGLFALCRELFGLEFRPSPSAEVWHPSVESFEVFREGRLLGRIFLDLAPRPGKYSHAACFGVRDGDPGRELPQTALLCNFFDPTTPPDRARLEYGSVVTFFHEFGHLLHHLFSGQQRWAFNSQGDLERDFIEAPSQLFEEWARDPATLARFAADPDTGEVVPRQLLERLRASEALGRPSGYLRQVALARISFDLYVQDPGGLDPSRVAGEIYRRYFEPWPDDYHLEASFGHLTGYSAFYYTYLWSMVIARDLLRPFLERGSLTDPATARRYAREILSTGSERPAAESIRAFLGRDFSFEAFERWVLTPARTGGQAGE